MKKNNSKRYYYLSCHSLVLEHFKNDEKKTKIWMSTINPLLGEVSPIEMIMNGRGERLENWIKNQLKENKI